jgi:hypothetical protein
MHQHLSAARFQTYRNCAASDEEAFQLYLWNMRLTGGVFEMIGMVEVAIRNAIDEQLRCWNAGQAPRRGHTSPYSDEWLKDPASPLWNLLNTQTRNGSIKSTYDDAKYRALQDSNIRHPGHPRHGHPVTHDDALAHVTFGLWPRLFPEARLEGVNLSTISSANRRKEEAKRILWTQAVSLAFPGQGRSYTVVHWVTRIHELRNRVAHHEPLILTDIASYHRTAARLLRAVDPSIGDWYAGISRVPGLLRSCPVDLSIHRLP